MDTNRPTAVLHRLEEHRQSPFFWIDPSKSGSLAAVDGDGFFGPMQYLLFQGKNVAYRQARFERKGKRQPYVLVAGYQATEAFKTTDGESALVVWPLTLDEREAFRPRLRQGLQKQGLADADSVPIQFWKPFDEP